MYLIKKKLQDTLKYKLLKKCNLANILCTLFCKCQINYNYSKKQTEKKGYTHFKIAKFTEVKVIVIKIGAIAFTYCAIFSLSVE